MPDFSLNLGCYRLQDLFAALSVAASPSSVASPEPLAAVAAASDRSSRRGPSQQKLFAAGSSLRSPSSAAASGGGSRLGASAGHLDDRVCFKYS